MRRRDFVRTGTIIATAGAAGLAGCSSQTDENSRREDDQPFEYFFDDQAGTLGSVGSNQIPDNVLEEQVLQNTRTEDEWREMQLNDHHIARLTINDEFAPFVDVSEGSVQAVAETTRELYNERSQNLSGEDAEIFSSSVLDAVYEETDMNNGAAASFLVPTLSEWILEEHISGDIPEYRWSNIRAKIGDAGNSFSHPLGLLQYEENGESQVKYAEIENRPTAMIVEPENSVYRSDLNQESFVAAQNQELDPSQYVSSFDYTKKRDLESQGSINPQDSEIELFRHLVSYVDDASMNGYDLSALEEDGRIEESGVEANSANTSNWVKGITSDSFGESLEKYVVSPGENYTRADFETTARAVYIALENQGFAGPIALDGNLSDPRVLHPTEQQVQTIRENRLYDKVASTILT